MEEPDLPPDIRRPRYRRDRCQRPPFVLQDRDRDIVRLVADFRLTSSDQIQALIPGSPQRLLRRLQCLYHAGYLERPPDQRYRGNGKMVYALGPVGAQLLVAEGLHRKVDADQAGSISAYFIDHALMISRFHAVLLLAVRQRHDVALDLWRQDKDLWDRVTATNSNATETIPVCPDAYFVLRLLKEPEGRNRVHVFLEADRGTMTIRRFTTKMRGYLHYRLSGQQTARYGFKNFVVLTVAKSPERASNLIRATSAVAGADGLSRMFLIGPEQNYALAEPAGILNPVWMAVDGTGCHSLLE